MRTKKIIICLCIIVTICLLSACSGSKNATFVGSKTGDQDHYDISFDILNTTYTHELDMKQGESIHVNIEKESGDIKIVIREGQEAPVYEGDGKDASDFSVDIPKDGTYTVSVTGKEAKGHVTFNRE